MIERVSDARRRRGAGFTLIELLVVIVILGILAAVVVFAVSGTGDRGTQAAYTTDLETIRTAQEAFCAKNGRYGTEEELVQQRFLSEESSLNDVTLSSGGPCQGTAAGSPSGGNQSAQSKFGMHNPDAVVKVAGPEDQWPTDPGTGFQSAAFAYPLNLNVYEPLIYLNSDYTFRPGLATSWERIPVSDTVTKPTRPYNNDTWRFHLRQGVKFHDGSEFDADDVMWSWKFRQAKGRSLGTVAGSLGYNPDPCCNSQTAPTPEFNSVEKIDQFTVDFTPRDANLRLPEQIVHPEGAIVASGQHFDSGPGYGTGPFKRTQYTEGVSASVERNDAYWGQEKAQVKRIDVSFNIDPNTRKEKLRAGEVDLAIDFPGESTQTAIAEGLRIVRSPQAARNQMIMVNKVGNSGFDLGADPNIRKAVSLAIDRPTYVSTVFGDGNAVPGRYMANPSILGSFQNLVATPPYDLAAARTALEASNWKVPAGSTDGIRHLGGDPAARRLTLKIIGIVDTSLSAYETIQGMLRAVGIDSTYTHPTTSAERKNLYNANTNAPQWDLNIESPNQNDGNPAFFPVLRFWGKHPGNPPSTYRFAPCLVGITYTTNLPCEFDDLGAASNVAATTPPVQEASAKMMKILVNDQAIAIPLAGRLRIMGMKSNVNLGDPHPSSTNQSWVSLTKTG